MGAHAICDETKCAIPTYSKNEVDLLLNELRAGIELLEHNLSVITVSIKELEKKDIDIGSQVGDLYVRVEALETKVGGS